MNMPNFLRIAGTLVTVAFCSIALQASAMTPHVLWTYAPHFDKAFRPGIQGIRLDAYSLDQWSPGESGELAMPNGKVFTITASRFEQHPNGDRSWIGKIHAEGRTFATILTYGSAGIDGEVRTPEGMFLVRQEGAWLVLIDTQSADWRLPDDASEDMDFSVGPGASEVTHVSPPVELKAAPAPNVTVDVMLAYTDGFVTRQGSAGQALTRLNQLIATANQAYVDSDVAITLRLVHAVQVSYSDTTTNVQALADLDAGNGALAGVPTTLRTRYGADVVALIRPFLQAEQASCGFGHVGGAGGNGANMSAYASAGFAAISDGSQQVGNLTYFCTPATFAHELGHNMGAIHDAATVSHSSQPNGIGAYSYSFGYVAGAVFNPASGFNECSGSPCFGTIMSYIGNSGILRFSNPGQTNCGNPTAACGTAAANVSQTFNNVRQAVAGWRATKVPFTGIQSGTPQTAAPQTAFNPLSVIVRDATNAIASNVPVTFAAPSSGASANLNGGGNMVTVNTDANGLAQVSASANAISGAYKVSATVNPGFVASVFEFDLTNGSPSPPPATTPTLSVSKKGTGSGTVTGSGASLINCGASCTSAPLVANTQVTLSATAAAGSTFTGWLGAPGCSGNAPCVVTVNTTKTIDATFAPSASMVPPGAFPSKIDPDLSSPSSALTDGLMVVRYLFGVSGSALTIGATAPGAARTDPTAIATYFSNIRPELDIDGDGNADALTDGVLYLRYLFGLRGGSLIQGAVSAAATRTTSAVIEAYLATLVN